MHYLLIFALFFCSVSTAEALQVDVEYLADLEADYYKLYCKIDDLKTEHFYQFYYTEQLNSWILISNSSVVITHNEGYYKCLVSDDKVNWHQSYPEYKHFRRSNNYVAPDVIDVRITVPVGVGFALDCSSKSVGRACLWYETIHHTTGSTSIKTIAASGSDTELLSGTYRYTLIDLPQEGKCSLLIFNAQEYDTRNFTCWIEPGIEKKSTQFTVKNHLDRTSRVTSKKAYLPVGNTKLNYIECKAESEDGKACIWTKKSETLPGIPNVEVIAMSGQVSDSKYILTDKPENGDCSLNITNVEESDAGNYVCNIEAGILKAQIEVVVKDVQVQLENIGTENTQPGVPTTLECSAFGFSGEVSYSISSISKTGETTVLTNTKSFDTDQFGDYICHASSDEFPVQVPSNVIHLNKDTVITKISGLLPVGSVGYIECKGPSGQGNKCVWEKTTIDNNGNIITEVIVESGMSSTNPRFQLNDNPMGGDCGITVEFAEESDAGNYTCSIEPDVAKTNVNLSVEVVTTHLEYTGPEKVKPGKHGHLICSITSKGNLGSVHYKINHKDFDAADWSLLTQSNEADVDKGGDYQCQGSGGNLLVTVQSNLVQVLEDDTVEDDLYIMYETTKLTHGKKYPFDFGDVKKIELTCVFQGSQSSPHITWSVNGVLQSYSGTSAYAKQSSKKLTLEMKGNPSCTMPSFQSEPEYHVMCMEEKSGKLVSVVVGKRYATTNVELADETNNNHKTVVQGSSLICTSDGNPEPENRIFLYKQSVNECWEEFSNSTADSVTVDNTGFYRCLVKNSVNTDWVPSNIVKMGLRKI